LYISEAWSSKPACEARYTSLFERASAIPSARKFHALVIMHSLHSIQSILLLYLFLSLYHHYTANASVLPRQQDDDQDGQGQQDDQDTTSPSPFTGPVTVHGSRCGIQPDGRVYICPAVSPCCSQGGRCGDDSDDAYCLVAVGCQPQFSAAGSNPCKPERGSASSADVTVSQTGQCGAGAGRAGQAALTCPDGDGLKCCSSE